MKIFPLFLFLMALGAACDREVAISNTEQPPAVEPADKPYVGVYAPLDGRWKGVFRTYRDTARTARATRSLKGELTLEQIWSDSSIVFEDSLLVEQHYSSQTPYFQRVTIYDYYPESGDTVLSKGVNKVQNGEMWCVIKKPDETVIHEGDRLEGQVITWERKEGNPYTEEYFHEAVRDDTYEIVGWGYYGDVDTTLSPPLWFYGKYERQ